MEILKGYDIINNRGILREEVSEVIIIHRTQGILSEEICNIVSIIKQQLTKDRCLMFSFVFM